MKKQTFPIYRETGQTLLEVLFAFSILVLVLGAVLLGVSISSNNAQFAKNQNLANSYAQEGISVIKKIRDSSLNELSLFEDFRINTVYCLGPNSATPERLALPIKDCLDNRYAIPSSAKKIFSREIMFEHDSSACCSNNSCSETGVLSGSKVTVRVSWADGKCPAGGGNPLCHKVELVTCFSNMDLKQTP